MNKKKFFVFIHFYHFFSKTFFVERVYSIFDRDGDGHISLTEFIDAMNQFARQDSNEKFMFLFKIYDIDGELRPYKVRS